MSAKVYVSHLSLIYLAELKKGEKNESFELERQLVHPLHCGGVRMKKEDIRLLPRIQSARIILTPLFVTSKACSVS